MSNKSKEIISRIIAGIVFIVFGFVIDWALPGLRGIISYDLWKILKYGKLTMFIIASIFFLSIYLMILLERWRENKENGVDGKALGNILAITGVAFFFLAIILNFYQPKVTAGELDSFYLVGKFISLVLGVIFVILSVNVYFPRQESDKKDIDSRKGNLELIISISFSVFLITGVWYLFSPRSMILGEWYKGGDDLAFYRHGYAEISGSVAHYSFLDSNHIVITNASPLLPGVQEAIFEIEIRDGYMNMKSSEKQFYGLRKKSVSVSDSFRQIISHPKETLKLKF